jgi:hypothetical protein
MFSAGPAAIARCRDGFAPALALAVFVQVVAGPEQEVLVPVTMPDGSTIMAEVADTTLKRARGLMFRDRLPKDRGMLFTFAEPGHWTFWMKNTRIALDIIWLDARKQIVHMELNVPGCQRTDEGCPQYQPNEAALYALEIAGGMAEQFKLKKGMKLRFQLPAPSS